MRQIELTEREIEIIEKQISRKIGMWSDAETKSILIGVIHKAETLMHELEAYEESGDDLIKWFYNKYKAQQTGNNGGIKNGKEG